MSSILNQTYRSAAAQQPQDQPVNQPQNQSQDQDQPTIENEAAVKKKMSGGNKLFWASLAIVLLGGFAIGLIGPTKVMDALSELIFKFVIYFVILGAVIYHSLKDYGPKQKVSQLARSILPQTLEHLNNGCTFNRHPKLDQDDLNFLGLELLNCRYECQDEIKGVRNGIGFKMMELETELKVKNRYRPLFKGVYLLLDVAKPFSGRVDIKKDLGGVQNAMVKPFLSLKRVRLEDAAFEKTFQVYADDQVEARYLLTTTMMQSLEQLRTLLGGSTLEASFYKGKLALSIECPRDLFEIYSGSPAESQRVIAELNKIFEAIDTMDLHTQHAG